MSTYSIGTPPTDADKLENLEQVLSQLPDNTQKLIKPKSVRNAVFTVWENILFKLTTIANSAISYIGIDNVDIKSKILIGKKEKTTGVSVMSNDLLQSDVDVFFFNTKDGTQSSDTKIAILAGTGSYFRGSDVVSPYIETSVINNGESLNLNIVNNAYDLNELGGDINISSEKGYVTINNLLMPKIEDNLDPSKNDYVLKFQWISGTPYAIWGTVSSSGGATVSSETFTDPNPVTVAIGGIAVGETFSNVPVTTMLRKLIYQYVAPTIQISFNTPIIEIGNSGSASSLNLNYSITRTATQSVTTLVVPVTPSISASSISIGATAGTRQITPVPTITSSNSWRTQTYTANIGDGVGAATSSINLIVTLPWFYGTSNISATQTSGINSILGTNSSTSGRLIPLLTNPATQSISSNNKTLPITTVGLSNNQGYIYFGYPSDFVDIIDIKDNNGYSLITSFRKFVIGGVTSPQSFWGGRTYSFWILTGSTSSTTPQLTTVGLTASPFQFIFAT